MHRQPFQVLEHEHLRFGARRIDVAARREHVEAVAELIGCMFGERAVLVVVHRRCAVRRRMRQVRQAALQARGEDLRAQRACRAQVDAFDADVGVEDLAAARIDVLRADRAEAHRAIGHPAHRRTIDVERVEVGVVGLHLDDDRVLEADTLEGLVPFEDARGDRAAVFVRDRAVEPVGDRLHRLGHRRARILLLQVPARDVAQLRRAREVVAEVLNDGVEVTDSSVGLARAHRHLGQLRQRIVQRDEQAARIRQRARQARRRPTRRHAGLRHRQARGRVVVLHLDHREVGRTAHTRDGRVAHIEPIALAVGALQLRADAQHVADEDARCVDQDRFRLRMRLARDGRAAEQAVRERRLHRARFRRTGLGNEVGVACDELHDVVQAPKLDQLRPAGAAADAAPHRAAVRGRLADAGGDLRA